MSVILLTGFEPWHDFSVNSSWETVQRLERHQVAGFTIATRRLPVSFGEVGEALQQACDQVQPDICIGFGMEPRGTEIRLERVAVNFTHTADYPDNAGATMREGRVVPDGPAAYFTQLPLAQIQGALERAQLPVRESLTAGAFLCNACFYRTMHLVSEERPEMVGGFVHVPPVAGTIDGVEGWPIERLARAAAVIVETTVKEIGNIHLRDALS